MKIRRLDHMIERDNAELEQLKDKDLSVHGHWSKGYRDGRLSVLEDLKDSIEAGDIIARDKDTPDTEMFSMNELSKLLTNVKSYNPDESEFGCQYQETIGKRVECKEKCAECWKNYLQTLT